MLSCGCRLLARLTGGSARALAGRPLSVTSRLGQSSPIRPRTHAQRQALCAAASTTTDKMAATNGTSVTPEEVEALRKQLEELQVRQWAHMPWHAAMRAAAAAARRRRLDPQLMPHSQPLPGRRRA